LLLVKPLELSANAFEKNWIKKRLANGATAVSVNVDDYAYEISDADVVADEKTAITFVGHSTYMREDDGHPYLSWLGGFQCNNDIVQAVIALLSNYDQVNQLNIFSCYSAIPGVCNPFFLCDETGFLEPYYKTLREDFMLSFCEILILKIHQQLQKEGKSFPENFTVLGCVGKVAANASGRTSVAELSPATTAEYMQREYLTIDENCGLASIDVHVFLAEMLPFIPKETFVPTAAEQVSDNAEEEMVDDLLVPVKNQGINKSSSANIFAMLELEESSSSSGCSPSPSPSSRRRKNRNKNKTASPEKTDSVNGAAEAGLFSVIAQTVVVAALGPLANQDEIDRALLLKAKV
jgi:hypothetical protein